MSLKPISVQIQREVASWPGVTIEAHDRGMVFFYVGRREIGHLHGSQMADLPFPVRIREKLVAAGMAHHHYLHAKSGWITYYIRGEDDVEPIIELFRLNYNRPWLHPPLASGERGGRRPGQGESSPNPDPIRN